MTHSELVEAGRKWLSGKAPVVITEIRGNTEEPDVLGFNANIKTGIYARTVIIECKVSRSDFYADAKKSFRRNPEQGMGSRRFFLAPKGLIKYDEIPCGWGLLETTGKRVTVVKGGDYFATRNYEAELRILVSVFRRLNIPDQEHISIKTYTILGESKNTTTLTRNLSSEDLNVG